MKRSLPPNSFVTCSSHTGIGSPGAAIVKHLTCTCTSLLKQSEAIGTVCAVAAVSFSVGYIMMKLTHSSMLKNPSIRITTRRSALADSFTKITNFASGALSNAIGMVF